MAKTREERNAHTREYMRKRRQEHPSDWRDTEKAKLHSQKYYQTHKDKVNAKQREYNRKHAEQIKTKHREYYRKHREEAAEYSAKNAEHIHAAARKRLAAKKKWFADYKRNLKCSVCGQSFPDCPAIIDFHHAGEDPKLGNVAIIVKSGASITRIKRELEKCIPVCANCHRILHDSEEKP